MNQSNKYLNYISDYQLKSAVSYVINRALESLKQVDFTFYDNAIDPFSAIFESASNNISLEEWIIQEKNRKTQKTLQNAIGEFHPMILGSVKGWEYLGSGKIIDIRNTNLKIIAEIKNKHNTTKGSDKKAIYDNLKTCINRDEYYGYTSYFVEIISKNGNRYDKPFTPSDNLRKQRKPKSNKIRMIDGATFYHTVTGENDAIWKLYSVIPKVIEDIYSKKLNFTQDLFLDLFQKTFK